MLRRNALGIGSLILLGAASPAFGCELQHKQTFFRSSGEGDFAHISDAVEPGQARTLYSRWCRVSNGETIRASGPVLYFGLNNRAGESGAPRYFLVKIFRYSADTRRNPLISYRRSGAWRNNACRGEGFANGYFYVGTGLSEISEFYRLLPNPYPSDPRSCRPFQRWLGSAFGRPYLSTYQELAFLRGTPRRVRQTGRGNWSLNLLASSYTTLLRGSRSRNFPVFEVTVDRAEELIVQVLSAGRMTSFKIAP